MGNNMANAQFTPSANSELMAQRLRLMQRAERAQKRHDQATTPLQGQVVSGHYIAPHWGSIVAQGLNQYQAGKEMDELPDEMADIQNELERRQQAETLNQFGFGGQGAMIIPGSDEQQSMAILSSVGPEEYSKMLGRAVSQRGTSAMQNAEAMGLVPGTPEYNAYIQQSTGTPQTTVNVGTDTAPGIGKLSTDYGYVLDPETGSPVIDPNTGLPQAAPVPGSPAYQSIEQTAEQQEGKHRSRARAATTVVQDLERGLNLIPELGALAQGEGVIGGVARTSSAKVPGTVANRITQFTESALSNVGLDTLQDMRENSPTGGALGQVPIQQQKRLEQVLGSLNIDQPPAVLEANIKRVINIYTDIIYGDPTERARAVERGLLSPDINAEIEGYYYELPFDERGRPIESNEQASQVSDTDLPAVNSPADLQGLASGALFRAPDGSIRRAP